MYLDLDHQLLKIWSFPTYQTRGQKWVLFAGLAGLCPFFRGVVQPGTSSCFHTHFSLSLGLQSYLLRRWDWGGCQEGPVIPNLRRYDWRCRVFGDSAEDSQVVCVQNVNPRCAKVTQVLLVMMLVRSVASESVSLLVNADVKGIRNLPKPTPGAARS